MPRQGSPSPHRRPQLEQRQSSTQSISKDSSTAGHLSKSHKGSSTRLHKTHAVGHTRHAHGRVPSYGKGLHKLSKLGPGEVGDGASHTRNNTRSASHTPTGSPTSQNLKRNSSNISLPRTGSKVSIKKNASNVSLTRNISGTKLGKQAKSEKAQLKNDLRKKTNTRFEVGDDDDDEENGDEDGEWEDNNSQSPYTTRSSSARPKSPLSRDPPSPDEPPDRSPGNLPASPPESPPKEPHASADYPNGNSHQKGSRYSQPPNADDVTHRLLNRSTHNAEPKTSTISATITPNGSASPIFRNGQDSDAFNKDPSMPADGISRFLSGTGSNSGSATPGSVSHLQAHLAHQKDTHHPERAHPTTPSDSDSTINHSTDRRTKSAIDLSHPTINTPSTASPSPPKSPAPSTETTSKSKQPKKPKNQPLVSPYESARGVDPSAGKSVTQLKIDLQRMSTLRDTPSSQHPLLQHGSVIGIQNLSASGDEVKARYAREYARAHAEYRNAVRFYPDLITRALGKKGVKDQIERVKAWEQKKLDSQKAKGKGKTSAGSSAETAASRGRVRFEVGRSPAEGDGSDGEDHHAEDDVRGLLERMWAQTDNLHGGDE
ncbi:hypothetical protein P7C71_g2526, partial [Lecanoromycetidae sp. Uapishka_2]